MSIMLGWFPNFLMVFFTESVKFPTSSINALFSSIEKEDAAFMKYPLKHSAFNLSSVTVSPFSIKVVLFALFPEPEKIGFTVCQNFYIVSVFI